MNDVHISVSLKEDLKKFTQSFSSGMASYVADEMCKSMKLITDYFYDSYEPSSYKRHYYNLRNNTFKRYYKNPHGTTYRGGIMLVNNLDDIYYHSSTDNIFNLFFCGMHGNIGIFSDSYETPVTYPTPLEMIYDKRNEIIENLNIVKKKGYSKANKNKYSSFYIK